MIQDYNFLFDDEFVKAIEKRADAEVELKIAQAKFKKAHNDVVTKYYELVRKQNNESITIVDEVKLNERED